MDVGGLGRGTAVLLLLAALAAVLWWQLSSRGDGLPAGEGAGLAVGVTEFPPGSRQFLPAVSGETLEGDHLELASFQGDPLVINVWGSWCGPCRKEAPDLARVARKTATWGVHFVGIDTRDNVAAGLAFTRRYDIPYSSLDDQNGEVLAQFAGIVPVSAVPSTLVVDSEGRIAARVVGPVDATTLTALLEELRPRSRSIGGY